LINELREDFMQRLNAFAVLLIASCMAGVAGMATAQTIIDEWPSVKIPAAPQLKPAKLDPIETAILVFDFTTQTCAPERRPRCAASVPKIAKLVAEARAKGAMIIYAIAGQGATPSSIVKELTPAAGETVLPALGPDKFIGSELEKMLKDKAITTVVVMGTQAQSTVLHTGSTAALKGFKVVVPVDAMSSDDAFPEMYTAYHLGNTVRIAPQVTLTKVDMVGY
jgi:nicotinamidase-related amidase